MRFTKLIAALSGAALGAGLATAQAAPFQDVLVQPPSIGEPQRGNLAGSLSKLAFGPGDVSRGTYALPLPIEAPGERGKMLASIFPSYSAENGISEWGMGWQADLSIKRHRVVGDLAYDDTDGFTSPWGRLAKGDDGAFYPAGLRSKVRLRQVAGGWEAVTADGTRYTYAAADAVATADGTYEWLLSRIDTILGDSTTLTWTRNSSGRAFISQLAWGGRHDGTQYRASFSYDLLPLPFVSYASGSPLSLDRRVARVTFAVKSASGGSYVDRWRYDLSYAKSPIGPAFYLTSIQRTYASGAQEPAATYTYDTGRGQLDAAALAPNSSLDAYLLAAGGAGLQPDHAAQTDLEQNGTTDLEHYYSLVSVVQSENGFTFQSLPPLTGQENPLCRPAPSIYNKPRLLARMDGGTGEPNVVVVRKEGVGATTRVTLCNRAGIQVFDQQVIGNWELGINTRLADTDGDRRPDLVRVQPGTVQTLFNVPGPQGFMFIGGPAQTLTPAVTPTATWVLDFNGDGKPDLMERTASTVVVWLGKGHGRFEQTGRTFQFKRADGTYVTNLSSYQFTHGDFNNDGLDDVILSAGQSMMLFANQGDSFLLTPVPAFNTINWNFGFPVFADLTASGNNEIVLVKDSHAQSMRLTTPSTGLLTFADDGKGTRVSFGYGRVKPVPGIVHRYSILKSLTLDVAGKGAVTYTYDYANPVWHTVGHYLVGFGHTVKTGPALVERVAFHHDDDISGVIVEQDTDDARTPGVEKYSKNTFENVLTHGVPWLRTHATENGARKPDGSGALATQVTYGYDNDVCATRTVTSMPGGELTQIDTLASVPALDTDMACLPSHQEIFGVRADDSLEFDYNADLARNDLGQITSLTQQGPQGPLVLQNVSYDANGRTVQTGAPGRGTVMAQYDGLGRLVSVVGVDGVVTRIAGMDPVNDAILSLETDRGAGGVSASSYAYDGQERLSASWNDYTGSGPSQPSQRLAYTYARPGMPGVIRTRSLVDANSGVVRDAADLLGADGGALATAAFADGRWHVRGLKSDDAATLTTRSYRRDPLLGAAALDGLTLDGLYGGALELSESVAAGLGQVTDATALMQAGVTRGEHLDLFLAGDELVTRTTVNGSLVSERAVDAAGRLVRTRDENGVEYRFAYDTLGRITQVTTPDGVATVAYDGYGRPAHIERAGVASFDYDYDPISGLQIGKHVKDGAGQAVRDERTERDAIGRATRVNARRASDGAEQDFWLDYDGAGATGSGVATGQKGFLSHVRGDLYERRILHDRAGRVLRTTWSVGNGWRQVVQEPSYRADGSVASMHVTVRGASGETLFETTRATQIDGNGRAIAAIVDGKTLYTLGYDDQGRVARADFASGESLVFDFDPTTGGRRGYHVEGPDLSGGVAWDRDARGKIASETFDSAAGPDVRHYGYDAAGRLVSSDDDATHASFAYSASGLPTDIHDQSGARNVSRASGSATINGMTYRWDAMGRVIQRGDLTLEYGPTGQLTAAHGAGHEYRYAYDESDNRVLKLVDGAPAIAYLGDTVLLDGGVIEKVDVEGVTVGIIQNGQFTLLLTDPRGTPVLDAEGGSYLPSPYGVRLDHQAFADALDYTKLGYDRDLGTVRMGVRDYDPLLAQFWTPDPKFLEGVEACADSPDQCNLFGYASGDPVGFTDPSGMDSRHPDGIEKEKDWMPKLNKATGTTFVPSHGLGPKDTVISAIDRTATMWRLQDAWAKETTTYYRYCDPFGLVCGSLHSEHDDIPWEDLYEVSNHLSDWTKGGGGDFDFVTKNGYTVRFFVYQPEAGAVVKGNVTGSITSEYVNGYTFATTTAWQTAANAGVSIGVEKVASASFGASDQRSGSTTDTTTTQQRNAGTGGTSINDLPVQAERATLMVGIAGPGGHYVWANVASPDNTNDRIFIMHLDADKAFTK